MNQLAKSSFALIALALLLALNVFNSCQINALERGILDNAKALEELRENGVAVNSSRPAASSAAGEQAGRCADPQADAVANDPGNLLKQWGRCWSTDATIDYSQTLFRHTGSDPRGLNPHIANGADNSEYNHYVGDWLAYRNPDNPDVFGPGLALSVTTPDDGLTYIIKLRKGVKWHKPTVDWDSGQYEWLEGDHEFVADDFVFVLDMVRNTQVAGRISSLRNYFESLESYRAIDDYTLEVKYSERLYTNLGILLELNPMPRWLYMHEEDGTRYDDATWGLKLNEHWYNQKTIGTGPYRFVEWEPGVALRLERNEDYWGERPSYKDVVIRIIKDQASVPRELKTQALDYVYLQPEQYRTEVLEAKGPYVGSDDVQLIRQPTLGYFYLGWNADKPLFSDKRVRQAMTMAMDRPAMVDNIFHGLGKVTSGPFAMQQPCYDTSIEPWPFDLEAAKAKLVEAGWVDSDGDGIRDKVVNGEKVKFSFNMLIYGSSTEYTTLSGVYREDLLSIGVEMTPVAVEWSTMLKKMDEREFDVYTGAWVLGWDTDLYQLWHSSEADKPKSSNRIGFRNPDADRIAEDLRREMNPDKRQTLCREFHALVHEEQPYTFIYQRERAVLYWDWMNQPEFSKNHPYRNLRHFSHHTARP